MGGGGKQVFVKQKFRVFFSIYFLIPNDQWVSGADNSILRSISHIYMQKIFFSFLSVVWMIFIWNLRACVVYSMLFFSLKATHTHHIFRRRKNNDKQKKTKFFCAQRFIYTRTHAIVQLMKLKRKKTVCAKKNREVQRTYDKFMHDWFVALLLIGQKCTQSYSFGQSVCFWCKIDRIPSI